MAGRENVEFNADKSVNQTDSVVQTEPNEFKLSHAGELSPRSSNESAVAEHKGFSEEQSDDVDQKLNNALVPANSLVAAGGNPAKKKHHGKRKTAKNPNSRTQKIKATVFVSDIDNEIAEEQFTALFASCGEVVDCRLCGDPNSDLRFGFVEFATEEGATNALSLTGTMLGSHTVNVNPSRTAIAPVDQKLLPTSEDERERCTRTIYCTKIDQKVIREDIKHFFESFCGEVNCLRMLGDRNKSTRSALVEFAISDSATAALKCSGVILGGFPIRVSPSKTPIKQGVSRNTIQ